MPQGVWNVLQQLLLLSENLSYISLTFSLHTIRKEKLATFALLETITVKNLSYLAVYSSVT